MRRAWIQSSMMQESTQNARMCPRLQAFDFRPFDLAASIVKAGSMSRTKPWVAMNMDARLTCSNFEGKCSAIQLRKAAAAGKGLQQSALVMLPILAKSMKAAG